MRKESVFNKRKKYFLIVARGRENQENAQNVGIQGI